MAARPMNRPSLSILLVEDHPTIARQVAGFLDGLQWQTDHAATGRLAIELATRHAYDVVLLDLNLPDIDGLEVCRQIKSNAPSNVPVLMLTARDAFEDKARGFRDGADDYLTKPFDLRELALRCEALARRGNQSEARSTLLPVAKGAYETPEKLQAEAILAKLPKGEVSPAGAGPGTDADP